MTDYQVLTAEPDEHGRPASLDDATFRRLLRGTVFEATPAGSEAKEPAQEPRRSAGAHCRIAMQYVD